MQRNMDLVRMILMRIESNPSGGAPNDLGIKSFSSEEIGYHAHIMMQEGLIEGINVTTMQSNGPEALPKGLTWKGHEFLDLARIEAVQRRLSAGALSRARSLSTDAVVPRYERLYSDVLGAAGTQDDVALAAAGE